MGSQREHGSAEGRTRGRTVGWRAGVLAAFGVVTLVALAAAPTLLASGGARFGGAVVDAAFDDTHGPLPTNADETLRLVSRAHAQLNAVLWGGSVGDERRTGSAHGAACASLAEANDEAVATRTLDERAEIAAVWDDHCAGGAGDRRARALHDRVDDLELYLRRGQGQGVG